MNAIREIVSGDALSQIVKLPNWLRNEQVEVIVMPLKKSGNTNNVPHVSRKDLDEMKKTSSVVELTGAISGHHVTASEVREERIAARYGSID